MGSSGMSLLQGTLDVLVLKALVWGPRHGYAVARWIRDTTGGTLTIEEGALYAALHRMERRGWLEAEWGRSENNRRAKFYRLTKAGVRRLEGETTRWTELAKAVSNVLNALPGEA